MDFVQEFFDYINWLISTFDRIFDYARRELGID